jgi:hypothetical protein
MIRLYGCVIGVLGTTDLPAIISPTGRTMLEEVEEKRGVLIINHRGLPLLWPRVRMVAKLNAVRNWEKLENPLVKKPLIKIEQIELIPCPQELF